MALRIEMKKSILLKKEFNAEFVCNWQYVTNYTNKLINNLNLFKKVLIHEANIEEINKWYKIFYKNDLKQSVESRLLDMRKINIVDDYETYREFALDEINRCKPFIDLHLNDVKDAVYTLNLTQKRIDDIE